MGSGQAAPDSRGRPSQTDCGARLGGQSKRIGTLGLKLCSIRSSAAHRRWRRPAVLAGDQQAACRRKGFLGDGSEPDSGWKPPGRRDAEGEGEGRLQPPRKDSLYGTRPKSEHLSDRRPHDAGAGGTRSGTAPCVAAAALESPECRLQPGREGLNPRLLLLTHVGQVRETWHGVGEGTRPGPTPRGCVPLGRRGLQAAQLLVGEPSARPRPSHIRAVRHCS